MMELTQAQGNTWYLEGLELLPLYRIDHTNCILLDTGLIQERENLLESLTAHGLHPVGVLSSHAHRDHSINNTTLRKRYGTKLALPAGEAAMSRSLLMFKAAYAPFSLEKLQELYGDMLGEMDTVLPLEDGPVDFCGVTFQVLHTPGHSPDHVCIVTPDEVCYLADAFMGGIPLERARLPYHYSYQAAIAQMKRIRDWDYPLYILAHRLVTREIGGVVDQNLAMLEQNFQDLLSLLVRPMTRDEILADLLVQRKLLTRHVEKAALYERNVQYMLEYLESTGQVLPTLNQGLRCWEKAQ